MHILSGEDWYIIKQSSDKIQKSFFRIGLLVAVIFIGSLISASAFIDHILENESWISIPIGILWALIITNLYILLLYTISPKLLPKAIKKLKHGKMSVENDTDLKNQNEFSFSLIFRFLFIGILAIIIAQPLNVLLLSKYAERSLENYKIEYRIKNIVAGDSGYIKNEMNDSASINNHFILCNDSTNYNLLRNKVAYDSAFLVSSVSNLDSLKKWNDTSTTNKETKIDSFRSVLNTLINNEVTSDQKYIAILDNIKTNDFKLESNILNISEQLKDKIESYNNLIFVLNKSDFYIKKIQILISENPFAWLFMFFIIGLFWLPIYFKYRIRKQTDFYTKKKEIEQNKIDSEYKTFNNQFELIFKQQYEKYNKGTLHKLLPILNVIEKLNPDAYEEIKKNIGEEVLIDSVKKYEHWADPPYRTKPKYKFENLPTEEFFINKLYK